MKGRAPTDAGGERSSSSSSSSSSPSSVDDVAGGAGVGLRSSTAGVLSMQQQQQQQQQPEHPSLSTRIVSGSVGSVATSLLVTPLDVVKVRVQAAGAGAAPLPPSYVAQPCPKGCGTFVLNNGQLECVLPKSLAPFFDKATGQLTEKARRALYAGGNAKNPSSSSSGDKLPGTFTMLRRIFRAEGLGGMYAGLRPTLVMAVPNTVLYFSAYDEMVWRLRRGQSPNTNSSSLPSSLPSSQYGSISWWIPPVSGGMARVVASTATAPFEFLRTRQASMVGMNQPSRGLVADFGTIMRQEGGIGSLYKGLRSTLWRDVPFSAVYWMCLERLREVWRQRQRSPDEKPSPARQAMQAFANGAVSGTVAAACTTPFDVVKTRQQQQVLTAGAVGAQPTQTAANGAAVSLCTHGGAAVYEHPVSTNGAASSAPSSGSNNITGRSSMGTFFHLREIARTEGVQGLWRGNQARMLKVAPACAIMISSYELGKRLLE